MAHGFTDNGFTAVDAVAAFPYPVPVKNRHALEGRTMTMNLQARCLRLVVAVHLLAAVANAAESVRVLDERMYHLGTPGFAEWQEFEGKVPHGRQLDLSFSAQANPREQTLFIRHRDVKHGWDVKLNGRKLGQLFNMEAHMVNAFAVPPGTLRDGDNLLTIVPPKNTDDIVVGEIKLDARPLTEALNQAPLEITVTDADTRLGLPCRITLVDAQGALAPFYTQPGQALAVRTGVVYTRDGKARLGVPAGRYTLYANRGLEYSVAGRGLSVAAGESHSVDLHIRREVPTPGFVACDSHIHNLTYSGHGDATIDEGMLTIAGEGIELAIATDHNHHTDYTEAALRMKVKDHFTSVMGNEVTTKAGHFNAFPVRPGSTLPDHTLTNWTQLMQSIRSTTGAKVIALNHPRDLHSNFIPLGETNYNAVTGENRHGGEFGFDAVEVITSGALQSDPMRLFRDWFAMLNYGYRIAAVGSSDTHYVSRVVLGQGRTYVACDDRDPAKIDLDEVCRSYREGRVLVSLGLLAQMKVNDRFTVGDLATQLGNDLQVTVTVLGPSWVTADRVELFANGVKIREQEIETPPGAIRKATVQWTIPRPAHDAHLVAIATGPGVTAPYWATPRPYQPSSKVWTPRVIGATNPIWIDGDGDGKFTTARQYATRLLARAGVDPAKLLPALADYDEAVATQAASLCQTRGGDVRSAAFNRELQRAAPPVQRGFAAYAATLPAN